MSEPFEWDRAEPYGVEYKRIDTTFLRDMDGDFCDADHVDSWGHEHACLRLPGHTGRHLALEYLGRYPVAVWS